MCSLLISIIDFKDSSANSRISSVCSTISCPPRRSANTGIMYGRSFHGSGIFSINLRKMDRKNVYVNEAITHNLKVPTSKSRQTMFDSVRQRVAAY